MSATTSPFTDFTLRQDLTKLLRLALNFLYNLYYFLMFFLRLLFISILCVWALCLHLCLCTKECICSHLSAWKRALCPMELELQVVESHHVGAGNGNLGPLEEQ